VSQENLERVKEGFAAHNRGDLDALVDFYDPDVVFETLLLGTHHGNEAIRLIYEENQKTLAGYDVEPVELIDAGDKVVAVVTMAGSGATSDISMDEGFAFVFTLFGSKAIPSGTFSCFLGRVPRPRVLRPWTCRRRGARPSRPGS
jgi:ketosteroid isomerase-like protein